MTDEIPPPSYKVPPPPIPPPETSAETPPDANASINAQLKGIVRYQTHLRERVAKETETLRRTKLELEEVDMQVRTLTLKLLEETLGSGYDARTVMAQIISNH